MQYTNAVRVVVTRRLVLLAAGAAVLLVAVAMVIAALASTEARITIDGAGGPAVDAATAGTTGYSLRPGDTHPRWFREGSAHEAATAYSLRPGDTHPRWYREGSAP